MSVLLMLSLHHEAQAREYVVVLSGEDSDAVKEDLADRGLEFVEYLDFAKRYAKVRSTRSVEWAGIQAEPNLVYRSMGGSSPPQRPPVPETPARPDQPEVPVWFPNDSRFGELWGLHNDVELRRDIQAGAAFAWIRQRNLRDVIVGVVDTGIDPQHPDLRTQLWENPQLPGTYGFNAIEGNHQIFDDNFHGTHVAGTIAAAHNNGTGISGLAPNARIMTLKFLNSSGQGTLADAIRAIDWARLNGAQVLNNSWGGGPYSKLLEDTIARAGEQGILFVAAAGNESNDNDSTPSYPASYQLPNLVSVAATNRRDELSDFSNYGARSVHIAAPGDAILSTVPKSGYRSLRGTSMAAPHVSAALALAIGSQATQSPSELRERLKASAEKLPSLYMRVQKGSGRLNVYNLLAGISPEDPNEIPSEEWNPAEEISIETPHPYPPRQSWRWTVDAKGSDKIRIRILRMQAKNDSDHLVLRDGTGQVRQVLKGLHARPQWSLPLKGPRAQIEFVSNSGDAYGYGFQIDQVQRTR